MKKRISYFLIVFSMFLMGFNGITQYVNAAVYSSTTLRLEAEESLTRSFSCTSFGSGISVQTSNPKDYDAWLRYHPVDFHEGYSSVSIRYAHAISAYSMWIELYTVENGIWNYITDINLPSTGSWGTFNTATKTLSTSISGRKDIYFIVKTNNANPQYISIDYFEFGNPQTRTPNTSAISDWSLYDQGRPNLQNKTFSNNIVINGNGDYLIENKIFYPSKDQYAISVSNHHTGTITIKNCYFAGINGAAVDGLDPGNGMGIYVYNSSNINIENNYFDFIQRRGIWVEGNGNTANNNIVIYNNKFYSMQAQFMPGYEWGWDCKFIQFFAVNGSGNKIWYNRMFNYPGISYACDWINIYISSGSYNEPIMVYYNELLGAGGLGLYNTLGCGIQIGDHSEHNDGGEYVYAKYNKLVFPGMVGMNINGGYKHQQSHNVIFSDYSQGLIRYVDAQSNITNRYTWTGMTLFNYSGGISRDSKHSVIGNKVSFQYQNGFVNVTNPLNTLIQGNDFTAILYPLDIIPYDFMND